MTARPLVPLSRERCLELLRSVAVGRIVFTDRALPAVRPVNFGVLADGDIVIRSGAGSKLSAAADGAVVAFEADLWNDATQEGWSVVVTGQARLVTLPVMGSGAGAVSLPEPWADGDRRNVIRISSELVEGRLLLADLTANRRRSCHRCSETSHARRYWKLSLFEYMFESCSSMIPGSRQRMPR